MGKICFSLLVDKSVVPRYQVPSSTGTTVTHIIYIYIDGKQTVLPPFYLGEFYCRRKTSQSYIWRIFLRDLRQKLVFKDFLRLLMRTGMTAL